MKKNSNKFQFLRAMSSNYYIKTRVFPNLLRVDKLPLSETFFGNIKYTGNWKEAGINAH